MKLKNVAKRVFLGLIVMVATLLSVKVDAKSPDYFDLIRDTNYIVNYYEDIVEVPGETHALYFPLKYSKNGNYLVFCTGDRSANTENSRYTKTNFVNDYDAAVVAAIIKAGVGENATKDTSSEGLKKFFFTQVAIWKKLYPNAGSAFPSTEAAINKRDDLRKLYEGLLAAGTNAKTRYEDIKNFKITLNATSLTFTLKDDVYESQVIKVSGKEIKSIKTSVNKGTVVEKDGGYVIRIAKSDLSVGKTKITLKVDATSNSIAIASNYTNGNSDQQTTTITVFDYYSNTDSKTISGEIIVEEEKQPIPISKKDATNQEELPGAKLVLTYPDGHTFEWESEETPKDFFLDPGTYQLRETLPPTGYIKSDEVIEFVVNEDGKVDKPVVMLNYPLGKTVISKIDATNSQELPGAQLILKDEKGNKIKEWISGDTPEPIYNLQPGKYYLTEIQAPTGYIKSKETITFTVDKHGKVETPKPMKNYPLGTTVISKQDIATSKELPGAHLMLKDENGNLIKEWISGDSPEPIYNLQPGKYYLTETQAPDGYILSTETIIFTVNEHGAVQEMIVMYNEMAPEIPDIPKTASFKTVTTSIIGLVTVALGAVIIRIAYKKNEA